MPKLHRVDRRVGTNLEKLMSEYGIYDFQLADVVGLERKSITRYRKGDSDIPLCIAKQITDFFGVSLDSLFTETEVIKNE